MGVLRKQGLTEQDIRSRFISGAITGAGWDQRLQIREEVSLTAGRVVVRGKHTRGKRKRSAYVLAVVEAKDKGHSLANAVPGSFMPGKMSNLRPGEASIWSSKETDEAFTKSAAKIHSRPRVTYHGGVRETMVGDN